MIIKIFYSIGILCWYNWRAFDPGQPVSMLIFLAMIGCLWLIIQVIDILVRYIKKKILK